MKSSDLTSSLFKIFSDLEYDFNPEKLTDDVNICDALGLDSLGLIEMFLQIEHEFNIEINDIHKKITLTFGEVKTLILNHLNQ